MAYEIEKNIPIAAGYQKADRKYPFKSMEIGDSFAVVGEEKHTVRAAAYAYGKSRNMKFRTRRDGDKMRVWRIA